MIITEKNNPKTVDIDLKDGEEIALLMNNEDQKVAIAVQAVLPQIGMAIEKIAERLRQGGRMAYFGAGTSGRIGILDAAEMSPTFGVEANLIQAFIAGGNQAANAAIENAEDSAECAKTDIATFAPTENDVVVAISASGNPIYTIELLKAGRQAGALTIAITSNPDAAFKPYADIFINPILGPEVISGSSRLKSGTAQKMILNMLSTGAMIRMGKVYKNYMIDLKINNHKLHERAINFVCEICATDAITAEKTLQIAGNVKTACVMLMKNCDKITAEKILTQNDGILRRISKN